MLHASKVRSAVLLILGALSAPALLAEESVRKVDVPAGQLTLALKTLAEQSGVEFFYPTDELQGLKTQGVSGEYTAEKALEKLLEGTKLKLTRHESGALVITAPDTAAGAAPDSTRDTLRLAHSGTSSRSEGNPPIDARESASFRQTPEELPELQAVIELEEVIVTGSHIRGGSPIGSRLITIDRPEIDASGYGRLQDYLETLPQNFTGISEDFSQTNAANQNRGQEIQLRGLGIGTTLVLVNGQRQPGGGLRGAFVDISTIPNAAIERVEVLTDGASALYGSDAIGGVVNIILRRDYEGAETRARGATASGERDELQLTQVFGATWSGGQVMGGYHYQKVNDLPASARERSALNHDYRSLGGTNWLEQSRSYWANPGTIVTSTGAAAYAIPVGQDGRELTAGDLIPGAAHYIDTVSDLSLLPEQDLQSVFLSGSQQLGRIELVADARFSRKNTTHEISPVAYTTVIVPSTNPFYVNPTGGTEPVRVAYDFTQDLGVSVQSGHTETYATTLGIISSLGGQWKARLTAGYGNEANEYQQSNTLNFAALTQVLSITDPVTALNVFGDGPQTNPATIDLLRSSDRWVADADTRSLTGVLDGPTWALPAGDVKVALGVDYREDRMRVMNTARASPADLARYISAAFVEVAAPIWGEPANTVDRPRLDLALSGRYERYSDFGDTFDPRFGITWRLSPLVQFRGNWGTSYRAPGFYQSSTLLNRETAFGSTVNDPRSPAGSTNVLVLSGNNERLEAETAETWTVGADLELPTETPVALSLSYYNITYDNKIEAIAAGSSILQREAELAALITRNPSPEMVNAICSSPNFLRGSCTNIAAIIDQRTRNLAVVETSGIDADLRLTIDTQVGSFSARVGGTYVLNFDRALTETAPAVDVLDTVANPLGLRMRGGLQWSNQGWAVAGTVNYVGSYQQTTSIRTKIASFTSVDLNVGYRFENHRSPLQGLQIFLSVVNAFDEEPPFVDQFGGYDAANGTLLGRLVSAQLVKSW